MSLTSEDVLFVSRGTGVVAWYRCGMPSFYLGCDWAALVGDPPHTRLEASLKRGGHTHPKLDSYKIVVLQQPAGKKWLTEIRRLQNKGIKVIYEVDDFLHGVHKIKSHKAREAFSKRRLSDFELCMRVCDAMICSTHWLAKRYRSFNSNIYVCENSIEGRRYEKFSLPKRDTLNIGWAGGEGHLEAVQSWLPAVSNILAEFPHARFLSMGLAISEHLDRPKQAVSLPFIAIENFPAALCNFDIAIAPAGRGGFYAAKSDLRFLETGALGIPLVADPFVYKDVKHSETGLLANNVAEAEVCLRWLVRNSADRQKISQAVRKHVLFERTIEKGIEQWEKVFPAVWDQ